MATLLKKHITTGKNDFLGGFSWVDALFAGLTYLFVLMIDPWMATVFGAPIAFVGTVLGRRWWPGRPVASGVVVLLNGPLLAIALGCLWQLGSFALVLGAMMSASILGGGKWLLRRRGRTRNGRFPLANGICFLLLTLVCTVLILENGLAKYPTEEVLKEVSKVPPPPAWELGAREEAVGVVYRLLAMDSGSEGMGITREQLLAEARHLQGMPSPYGVYVTLYDGEGYQSRGEARGSDALSNLMDATADAISKKPRRPRFRSSRKAPWGAPPSGTRVQIDIPGPGQPTTIRPLFYLFANWIRGADKSLAKLDPLGPLLNLGFQYESGVDGLYVTARGEPVPSVMLPADPVTGGWFTPRVRTAPGKVARAIVWTWRRAHKETLDLKKESISVTRFRTLSFGAVGPDEPVIDWFRGNVVASETLSRERLVAGIMGAADWLVRQVGDDGKFDYEKYPPYRNQTSSYNLPRHAGSVYGLFAIHRASGVYPAFEAVGGRALRAGLRALGYIGENLGTPTFEGDSSHLCFLDERGVAESGSTALAAMSIAELTDGEGVTDPTLRGLIEAVPRDRWLAGMGACMLQMIDRDGAVFRNYRESRSKESVVNEPLYYPGEVMLALIRLYNRLGDERLLEGASRIGDRQLKLYALPLQIHLALPGDHWIVQGLSELAVIRDRRDYAALAVLMGNGYLREQHPPQAFLYPDYQGAYRRIADLPRTTRAASRGEALGGALRAARFLGEDPAAFKRGLIDGARHLIEQQYHPQNAYYIPSDHDVYGAIRMGLVDNHCRIDNNQHAVVALLNALAAMDRAMDRE